ncbi:hypothetical protein [Arthrobacter agilis]|uniref:hypothetical protein n=1 Tax=Arthrobacter agilis TaxID=37921 RepID=UPI00278AA657|nr:hypothetical protein [Arthrobacter agilis]MDQ0734412.1 hypothetical protein [Arthrobacter agilis]
MRTRQDAPGPADRGNRAGRFATAPPGAVRPVPLPAPAAEPLPAPLPQRGRIKAHGVIARITIAPATAPPSFAVLARIDWNGANEDVRIVWMGQRRVPGIEAGVALRFEGMLSRVAGTPTVYNPRYEIIGRPEEY